MKITIRTPRKYDPYWSLKTAGRALRKKRLYDLISRVRKQVLASKVKGSTRLYLEVDYGYHTDVFGKRARFTNESCPTGTNELVKHIRIFTDGDLLEYFT